VATATACSAPRASPDGEETATRASRSFRAWAAIVAVATALLPPGAEIERLPCSSPGYAADLLARITGDGAPRVLLLGHLDTVFAHESHRPLEAGGEHLVGSGAVDMKGGVALALGVLGAVAGLRDAFAEIALLLVTDEEWRTHDFAHTALAGGYDACLCFEAGQLAPGGEEAVIVRRKAAGTLRVEAHGRAAHSGSAPDRGRNALLALTAAAERVAAFHEPGGVARLTAVPTILRSGEAFNVVPARGELLCDLRADRLETFDDVLASIPREVNGATLDARLVRRWPGMDAREATAGLLERAGGRLGRPIVAAERGGASDASHVATVVPLTVDGLGPRGGGAHGPEEFVLIDSLRTRAEVALAIVAELLDSR